MCFAVQCTLCLAKLSRNDPCRLSGFACAVDCSRDRMAQLSCWYAVITLNHLGHVVEELLWTFIVALLAVGFANAWLHTHGVREIVLSMGIVCGSGAVLLMSLIDVPMYIARWHHQRRAKTPYLPLWGGLQDTLARRHLTRSWIVWRREVPWMTLYFTVGVWLSIAMALIESLAP